MVRLVSKEITKLIMSEKTWNVIRARLRMVLKDNSTVETEI